MERSPAPRLSSGHENAGSGLGWALSTIADDYGFAIGRTLYPYYSPRLVVATTIALLAVTTVVSYLPTRRIASLQPTDALRGRLL